jgi:hypothetical protein
MRRADRVLEGLDQLFPDARCELDHQNCLEFLGIDYETCARIYRQTMKDYFDDKSDEEIEAISRKAQIIGYTRIMRRCIRRNGFDMLLQFHFGKLVRFR